MRCPLQLHINEALVANMEALSQAPALWFCPMVPAFECIVVATSLPESAFQVVHRTSAYLLKMRAVRGSVLLKIQHQAQSNRDQRSSTASVFVSHFLIRLRVFLKEINAPAMG